MPSRSIAELLKSPQFGGQSEPLPAARPRTSTPPARAALPQPEIAPAAAQPQAAAPAPDLAALLATLGLGPAPPVAPPPPAPPAPRQPTRSPAVEKLIAAALKNEESAKKPLWLSADDLDELGIDTIDLGMSLAHLKLHAAENVDARGGVLFAPSPGVLEAARRLKNNGKPVPFVSVMPAGRDTS
jgi:hypothetical protein